MNDLLDKIPSEEQRQDSLKDQLDDLIRVANKLGMYDASDAVQQVYGKADSLNYGCFVAAFKFDGGWCDVIDDCVCDYGCYHECTHATDGMRREQCNYWRVKGEIK